VEGRFSSDEPETVGSTPSDQPTTTSLAQRQTRRGLGTAMPAWLTVPGIGVSQLSQTAGFLQI
jgi:hypothetical protein